MAMALPDAAGQLRHKRFGTWEPTGPLASVPLENIGYIAVPGIAFDYRGGRLAFGKGCYDRFCSQLPPTVRRSGLACSLQVVARAPQEAHAIPMHSLITEQGGIPCRHSLPVVSSGLGPVAHKGDPIVEYYIDPSYDASHCSYRALLWLPRAVADGQTASA